MQDFFSVELQSPDGKTLPFIEHDQQRWFVGEPGQEFVVAARRSANTRKVFRVSTIDADRLHQGWGSASRLDLHHSS